MGARSDLKCLDCDEVLTWYADALPLAGQSVDYYRCTKCDCRFMFTGTDQRLQRIKATVRLTSQQGSER